MTNASPTTSPAEAVATYFAGWRSGDLEAVRSVLADGVTFAGPLGTAGDAEECLAGLSGLASITEDIEIHKTFVDGPDVLTWFTLRTSAATVTPVANLSHVEGGRITRIRVTFDPRPFTDRAR